MAKAKKPAGKPDTSTASAKDGTKAAQKSAASAASNASAPVTSSVPKTAAKKPADAKAKPADAKAPQTAKPVSDKTPAPDKVDSKPAPEKASAKAAPTPASAPKAEPAKASPAQPEHSKPTPPVPTPAPQERRGGFVPLVLGGIIAGAIGFFAAQNDWFSAPDTTAQQIAATEEQTADNAARLTALEGVEVDLSPIDDLKTLVKEVSATLADIDARLTVVEERPAADGGPSIAEQTAFEKELNALKASAEEQRAEIATLLDNAQSVEEATAAAARAAQVQAAVSKITAAMGSGQPFADTLATLTEGGIEVPAALSDVADEGVATMASLQARFPDVARAALGVARSTGAMEGDSGFGGFLKRQLGARSTQPREGSDPDAVLSRAEANVVDGALDAALTEIDTLPEDVQSALQDWLDDARARNAAQAATQELSQSQPAN